MKVGYVRVSTIEQNEARQEVIMNQLGVEKVFIDKLSGKDRNRPALKQMLDFVRNGDTVIIESYSRLARSTTDLLNIVDELQQKGVNLISKKEDFNTTTPQGRLIVTIFAGLSQFERECTLERQKEGIAVAKQEGKYKGRQPIQINQKDFEKTYHEWKAGGITARKAQERLNLKPNTFYRRVKLYETAQE